jgi:hypothetical protein
MARRQAEGKVAGFLKYSVNFVMKMKGNFISHSDKHLTEKVL